MTTITGSINSSRTYSLNDSTTGASSTVQSSSAFNVGTRPTGGPPATPTDTDKKTLYGNRVAKASFAAIDATTPVSLTFATLSDILCDAGSCSNVSSVLIQNIGAYPLSVTWSDISASAIKIGAYGEMLLTVPMDGITVSDSTIDFLCGTASQTTDAVVVISYRV